MDKADILAAYLTAFGTLALAFVAAFQDKIRAWLFHPQLTASISVAPPDCHKTILNLANAGVVYAKIDCYYFRLRIKNSGNQRAELVEVFASELLRQQADGSFLKVETFLPMNLLWTHIARPFFDAISPGMEKHCDLGSIIKPTDRFKLGATEIPIDSKSDTPILSLALEVKPTSKSHLINPGKYKLVLLIGAANAKPVSKTIEINLTGCWYDDESRMLREGIGIRMIEPRGGLALPEA